MASFKKLLSKFEIPSNDWVLSRFGRFEAPAELEAVPESAPESEPAPASQAPISVAARLFEHWFAQGQVEEPAAAEDAAPPQSGDRMSPNASAEAPAIAPERKSSAS